MIDVVNTSRNITLLCRIPKAHFTQHFIFKIFLAWQEELDKSGFAEIIPMDLLAYDLQPDDTPVPYSIGKTSLKLIHSYLSNWKYKAKINSLYCDWYDIVRSVPQVSILGPLFFKLFIDDFFFFIERTKLCSFTDDTTINICQNDLVIVLEDLK